MIISGCHFSSRVNTIINTQVTQATPMTSAALPLVCLSKTEAQKVNQVYFSLGI